MRWLLTTVLILAISSSLYTFYQNKVTIKVRTKDNVEHTLKDTVKDTATGTIEATSQDEQTLEEKAFDFLDTTETALIASMEGKSPYLSVMGYILDNDGNPVVSISELALHTQNIEENPEIAFCVHKPDTKGIRLNGARITIQGKFVKTEEKEYEALKKAYLKTFPDGIWVDFGDFHFYRLKIDSVYFIGGFGEINYCDMKEYRKAANKE